MLDVSGFRKTVQVKAGTLSVFVKLGFCVISAARKRFD